MAETFDIFLVVPPGLEPVLAQEVVEKGWKEPRIEAGGVTFSGGWPDVWRANLELRGATRVLARIGGFRAMHLAQLDKRARKFDWSLFRADQPIKVEVTSRKSRIYHAGAARQRIEGALQNAGLNISETARITLRARIDDDFCTFSVDTSGDPLHKRGHKVAVGKAPMRETLAANILRLCGYDGSQPLVDPMCGSGTFAIEAAEMYCGLQAGRARSYAFEDLASFEATQWQALRQEPQSLPAGPRFFGSDRDQGVIGMAKKNAERAGLENLTQFTRAPIGELLPPEIEPGLVIVNPPYGARIGNKKALFALYGTLGNRLKTHFSGWRFGIVTSDKGLARATGLSFANTSSAIPHGGLKIYLFQGNA